MRDTPRTTSVAPGPPIFPPPGFVCVLYGPLDYARVKKEIHHSGRASPEVFQTVYGVSFSVCLSLCAV